MTTRKQLQMVREHRARKQRQADCLKKRFWLTEAEAAEEGAAQRLIPYRWPFGEHYHLMNRPRVPYNAGFSKYKARHGGRRGRSRG